MIGKANQVSSTIDLRPDYYYAGRISLPPGFSSINCEENPSDVFVKQRSVDWTLKPDPMYLLVMCPMDWGKNSRTLDGRSVYSVTSFYAIGLVFEPLHAHRDPHGWGFWL
jgi:hypothetical protein